MDDHTKDDDLKDDDLKDDDQIVGRLLTRREALALFAAGAVLLPACGSDGDGGGAQQATSSTGVGAPTTAPAATTRAPATVSPPACVVKPELTEGPFFVDERLNRSDIRVDPSNNSTRPGAQLRLSFRVSRVGAGGQCTALAGAMVDVWHCDAAGLYSDVSADNTVGQKFLRGFQTTDASGGCAFTTIYPGAYQGRSVHIHLKIRMDNRDFTSQLFFDDSFTSQVHANAPYRSGSRTMNSADGIFRQANDQLTLEVTRDGSGFAASFDIGMQF